MNRREALSRIGLLAGGTLSASTLSGLLAGCSTPAAEAYIPKLLSEAHFQLVGKLAESIIPETDTSGALSAGVHRFIDTMLAEYYPSEEAVLFGGDLLDFESKYNASGLNKQELNRVVGEIDSKAFRSSPSQNEPEMRFYRKLKGLVVSGYYTSEVGMTQELRLRPYGDSRMDIALTEIGLSWSN